MADGRELIEQGIEERYRWVDQLAEMLSDEEKARVSEALTLLTTAAQDFEAEPSLRRA